MLAEGKWIIYLNVLKNPISEVNLNSNKKDKDYIEQKGLETIRQHACGFISKRLAPAVIPNDGKQTPMKGHPVFTAQHATATCCRGCLYKWHKIEKGTQLTEKQQDYVVNIIMEWINRQLKP